MKQFEITCITRDNKGRSHADISHIGNAIGQWRITSANAIAQISIKASAFFIKEKRTGDVLYLAVFRDAGKAPCLRILRNENWSDELLSLPECSPDCLDY